MVTLERLRREQRAHILDLARAHGCRNIRVFGSVSTGRANQQSDLDLLVDLDPGRGLLDLGAFQMGVENLLLTPVEVVESGSLHPYVRDRVLLEAVPL